MRGSKQIGLGIATVAALIALAAPSAAFGQAQTITPTRFDDPVGPAGCQPTDCSLRQALAQGAVTVNLLPGVYELSQGSLSVQPGTVINGAGARATTVDANNLSRVFYVVESTGSVTINDLTVTGGNGDVPNQPGQGFGGGVYVENASRLTLSRSTVIGNRATNGGGISTNSSGLIQIVDSTVSGNFAGNLGGGIAVPAPSNLRVVNSTFSSNQIVESRQPDGAGVYALGALELLNVTIAGNVPAGLAPGSSLAVPSGQVPASIRNTLVAAEAGAACAIARPRTGTHNLDDDGSCGFAAVGDKPGINPLLGPLQNNGGPTNTHALSAGSPAIGGADPGTCTGTDQRGVARPQQGACDIGAFEYRFPTLRVITQVVNDHGGTRNAGDFSVHVRAGADVAGSPQPGSPAGTTYTVAGGSYTVSGDALAKYAITVSGDCSPSGAVTLGEGEAKTCTIVANDPPPVIRKFVNVLPKSGTVRVKRRGRKRFVRLTEGQQIPVGSIIDARKGRVTLVAAADNEGRTATADFYQGLFKVGQTKGAKPFTTAELTEKLSCAKAGKANIAARKKRKRRLWGDGSGRFRTEGQYSSATVRGTIWLTQDHCDRTWTKVTRGKVAVRDFIRRKTILVRAGKQYIARAKKR